MDAIDLGQRDPRMNEWIPLMSRTGHAVPEACLGMQFF